MKRPIETLLRAFAVLALLLASVAAYAGGGAPKVDAKNEKRLDALWGRLDKAYPKGFVVKPVNDAASGSVLTSKTKPSKVLHDPNGKAHHKEWLGNMLDEPSRYLVQEYLPIRKSKALISRGGGSKEPIRFNAEVNDEFRVHVVAGKVVPGATYHRWAISKNLIKPVVNKEMKHIETYVQENLDKLPARMKDGTPMALDVAALDDGSYKIIETNAGGQSGFLAMGREGGVPTFAPHKLYQFVTGHATKVVSFARAVGAALPTLALSGNPVLAGIVGTAAYAYSRKVKYSSDPAVREMQEQAHGKMTWIEALGSKENASPWRRKLVQLLRGPDGYIEEKPAAWSNKEAAVEEAVEETGKVPAKVGRVHHIDGAVFVGGVASQALRYQGDVTVGNDVVNILKQEDKLTESRSWNRYAPGSIGRAQNLNTYMKPGKEAAAQ